MIKFEDLSIYDINLIKDMALQNMLELKGFNRIDSMYSTVLAYLNGVGFELVPNAKSYICYISEKQQSADALLKNILELVIKYNIIISKTDKSRTWSYPKASHFEKTSTYKKPWVF